MRPVFRWARGAREVVGWTVVGAVRLGRGEGAWRCVLVRVGCSTCGLLGAPDGCFVTGAGVLWTTRAGGSAGGALFGAVVSATCFTGAVTAAGVCVTWRLTG